METQLVLIAIVFELPVRRRSDDEMDGLVGNLWHSPRVADYYFVVGCHILFEI